MQGQRRPVLCPFREGWSDFRSGSCDGLCRRSYVNVVLDSIVMCVCLDWEEGTFREPVSLPRDPVMFVYVP